MSKNANVCVIDFRPEGIPSWNPTRSLVADYINEITALSNGVVNYIVSEYIVCDEFPKLDYRRQYDAETYNRAIESGEFAFRLDNGALPTADYRNIIEKFQLLDRVFLGICSEVWLFGGPYFGFYESRMVGRDAYWCNSPPIVIPETQNFIMMGFNYERGVREMLHSFGHRVESILSKEDPIAYRTWVKKHGTVHRAPGNEQGYSQDERQWLSALYPRWWNIVVNDFVQASGENTGVCKFLCSFLQRVWHRLI